jgi:hypothetical protein
MVKKSKIIVIQDDSTDVDFRAALLTFFLIVGVFVLLWAMGPVLDYKMSVGKEASVASTTTRAEAGVADLLTLGMPSSASSEDKKSEVRRVRASNDSQLYYVASSLPEQEQGRAANKLAEINRRAQMLMDRLAAKQGTIKAADDVDITENIHRLLKRHHRRALPIAEYHNPGDNVVGYNMEKGDVIELCIRSKSNPAELNSDNTLFRVALHELAHSADKEYRGDGESNHGPVFKRLHQYLLGEAEEMGLYNCGEYEASGKKFCGLTLTEDYCGA